MSSLTDDSFSVQNSVDERACVWWDLAENTWSSRGCRLSTEEANPTQTVCLCDHLTNFGIIFDYKGQADANNQALSILTDVLLTLSCLAILATQLMLWLLK